MHINGRMHANQGKPKGRKNVPIDADLHHRLDMYATSVKATIRDIAEEAIEAYLASMSAQRARTADKATR